MVRYFFFTTFFTDFLFFIALLEVAVLRVAVRVRVVSPDSTEPIARARVPRVKAVSLSCWAFAAAAASSAALAAAATRAVSAFAAAWSKTVILLTLLSPLFAV